MASAPAAKKQRTASRMNHQHKSSVEIVNPLEDENILRHVFSFVPESYRYVGGVNRGFRTAYRKENGTTTGLQNAVASIATTQMYLMDKWKAQDGETPNGTLWQFL